MIGKMCITDCVIYWLIVDGVLESVVCYIYYENTERRLICVERKMSSTQRVRMSYTFSSCDLQRAWRFTQWCIKVPVYMWLAERMTYNTVYLPTSRPPYQSWPSVLSSFWNALNEYSTNNCLWQRVIVHVYFYLSTLIGGELPSFLY